MFEDGLEGIKKVFDDWELISSYSRAQAIADGVLVDLDTEPFRVAGASLRQHLGIRYNVAMTAGAFASVVPGAEELEKSSVLFLLSRVLNQFKMRIAASADGDSVHWSMDIPRGERTDTVDLWAVCGPGDTAEPVITIMLEGED